LQSLLTTAAGLINADDTIQKKHDYIVVIKVKTRENQSLEGVKFQLRCI
jgi:Holliday junction resolvase-like predicted endonuclease